MRLLVAKRSRPWADEDLPRNICITQTNRGSFDPQTTEKIDQLMAQGENFVQAKAILRNNLLNCSTCSSLEECLEKITGCGYLGNLRLLRGRMVTNLLNEMFNGERCMICLKSNTFQSAFLPSGYACRLVTISSPS